MLDVGFSEILVIFVLALVVLGPEKLPRVASQLGRWVGRARAMARQFKDQLEEEVNLDQVRKANAANPPTPPVVTGPEAQSQVAADATPPAVATPDPVDFTADTFSHAHATDEHGANPHHPNGAPEPLPQESTAAVSATDNVQRPEGAEAYPPVETPAPVNATTSSHERGS
jgi:sec-independent protein translocase protein TatB